MALKKHKLGELCEIKRGMSLSGEYYATEGKLIRLTLGNFDYQNNSFKLNTSKDNLYFNGDVPAQFIMKKGDIITPLTEQTAGLLGSTAKIPESGLYIQSQDVAKIVCNEKINPDFAFYLISSSIVKNQLSAGAQQTKIRHTSPDKIKDCVVFIPSSVDEQKRIAKVLTDIDSKIALNKKINKELETMAKEIYDYWFVQFDFPNAQGKPYKSSGGKMVYNPLLKREIPEGWEVKDFRSCLNHINTGLNPRDNFKLGKGNIKYITVKNLTTDGVIDFSGCDLIDEKACEMVHERSQITKGDILFASISPLGRCYIIQEQPKEWDINESVFSICPKQEITSSEYLYCYLTSEWFMKKAEKEATGSIFAGIRMAALNSMPIIVPDENTMKGITENLKPLFLQKDKLFNEIQYLTILRDELLPLLMNGQVRVKE